MGAALYGVGAGAYLGGVFGTIVLICCISGMDVGGSILWNINPLLTAVVCLGKGIAAGAAAGKIYSLVQKKNDTVAAVCAGVAAPVTNTALFALCMYFFFWGTMTEWAGGTGLLYYAVFGLAGINFLVELGVNLVLAPISCGLSRRPVRPASLPPETPPKTIRLGGTPHDSGY